MSDSAAIPAAVTELELSMEEVLRQRQAQIRREHSRQLATLEEKLEEELEKAARQAKEKVSMSCNDLLFRCVFYTMIAALACCVLYTS